MKYSIAFLCCLFLLSCSEPQSETSLAEKLQSTNDTNTVNDEKISVTQVAPKPKSDTFCYMMMEGTTGRDTNVVRIINTSNKITGELKYMPYKKEISRGQLIGEIENNIITAKWTYFRGSAYYEIPVAFKMAGSAIFQKATAVDSAGRPYIPEEGEYQFKFSRIECSNYPTD